MKNKFLITAATLIGIVVLFLLATQFYKKSEAKRVGDLSASESALFEREHSPTQGNKLARVTLVEFLDPECESCRAFYPVVKHLMKEFEGSLRLVIRYAPFHPNSKTVVKILEASRLQGKYWETLEKVFLTQPEWGDHHKPRPDLLWKFVQEVGIDMDKLQKDMESPDIQKIIELDIQDGQKLGVRQTPTFFVNGKPLPEFGPDALREMIRKEAE